MDKVEFRRFLESLNRNELEDYLEQIWREKIQISEDEAEVLEQHIKQERVRKYANYVHIFILLAALLMTVPEYDGVVKTIYKRLPPVDFEEPAAFDMIWQAQPGACPICAALHGKVFGKDIKQIPQVHPNCRCKLVKVPKGEKLMPLDKVRTLQAGAVRAVTEGEKRILEILAAPFGDMNRKDRLGQYLSQNTDYMVEVGDRRPLLYFHGFTPRAKAMKQPKEIGPPATVSKIDHKGVWMRGELFPEGKSELADRTWRAALVGKAAASTGSVNYLERHDKVTGEVITWPIAELSVFDTGDKRIPVSDDAVVLPLRALFEENGITLPDNFEAGEDKKEEADNQPETKRSYKMNEDIKAAVDAALADRQAEEEKKAQEKEAMRAEIVKELKKEPKYRSTFNVNSIDDKEAKKDAGKEETFAYVRALIQDAKTVLEGGMPSHGQANAMRVLEESEALEIGPMVPEDLYNQIHGILGKYSLVDKIASMGKMTIYKTDKLTFSVPTETTAMTALSDIAEEGAYTANEMAFAAKTATMQKVGNYLSVTEEALEDQDLFQQYLAKACAKAIALSKNADLHALLDAVAGTNVATDETIVDGEVIDLYYGLAQEYRDDAVFLMNDGTLGYLRAMLVATPRAYGEFGFQPMSMGEVGETFLNKFVFTNSNWSDITGSAANETVVDFVNLDELLYWVERRKMSIFVDPYSTKLSAGTVNFLPSARYAGVVVNNNAKSGLEGLT